MSIKGPSTWMLALMTVAGLAASTARAEDPPPAPITAPSGTTTGFTTRGAWLENNLTPLVNGCLGNKKLMATWKKEKTQEVSAVTTKLRSAVSINAEVRSLEGNVSLTRLFGAVWSTNDLLTATRDSDDLPLEYENDDDLNTMPGIEATRYVNTCSGIIRAAMGADGQYDVGMAALKAGLESSFSTTEANRVDLVNGTFDSPILNAWDRKLVTKNPGGEHLSAALVLWHWYEIGDNVDSKGYLLKTFKGDALYRRTGQGWDVGAAIKSSGRFNAFGQSLTASGDASLSTSERLTGQSYRVAIERTNDKLNHTLEAMPSPEKVAQEIEKSAHFELVRADTTPIVQANSDRVIVQKIDDFPRNYCDDTAWISTVGLDKVDVVDPPEQFGRRPSPLTTCQFTFRYKTKAAEITAGATVSPELSRSLTHKSGSVVKAVLRPAAVTISSGNLRLARQSPPGKPTRTDAGGGNSNITWTTGWLLYASTPLASDPVTITNTVLDCPTAPALVNAPTIELGALQGNSPKSFKLGFVSLANAPIAEVAGWLSFVPCTLKVDMDIKALSGEVVHQPRETLDLLYPVAKAVETPAPAQGPA